MIPVSGLGNIKDQRALREGRLLADVSEFVGVTGECDDAGCDSDRCSHQPWQLWGSLVG